MRFSMFSSLVSALSFAGALSTAASAFAQAAPPREPLATELGNFDCAGANAAEQIVCGQMLEFVNAALDAALLQIESGDPLYVFEDTGHVPLATGHSCTHTAKVTYRRFGARLAADDGIPLVLDSLSEPVLLLREYPAHIDSTIGVQEEFGVRLFGCNRVGSDSYTAAGSARTRAKLSIAFTAGPTFERDRLGNVIATLRPTVAVSSALDQVDVPLAISGRDLSPIASLFLGLPGTLLRTAGDLFEGESVRSTFARFTESSLRDLTFAAAPLAPDFVIEQLRGALDRGVRQEQAGFANQLQDDLQEQIAEVLGLDADGELKVRFLAAQLPR